MSCFRHFKNDLLSLSVQEQSVGHLRFSKNGVIKFRPPPELASLFFVVVFRKLTITDAIERCLKKGKGEEVSLAARASILVCIQLGAGEGGEEIFKMLKPLLLKLMLDNSVALKARAAVSITFLSS